MMMRRTGFFLLFLFIFVHQIEAISTSVLAKIKQATVDLDTLLAQQISTNPVDHGALLKRLDELLAIVNQSSDTKMIAKYKGLVDSKKQSIELSEKNVVLQERVNVATTQVAVQEKQLAKASKQLESVGLSLPRAKTMVSDLIDDIDLFMKDFESKGNESNFDSYAQKLDAIMQQALKKAENQDVKNKIDQLKMETFSIVYARSLDFIEEGLKGINHLCLELHNSFETAWDPIVNSFNLAIFADDYDRLILVVQDSVEQVKLMHDIFKRYCIQNNFGKKTVVQLSSAQHDAVANIVSNVIDSYEKVLLLLLDVIETFNEYVQELMDDPDLAYQVKERIRSNSDDWYNYFVALDLFNQEFLGLIPAEFTKKLSPDLDPIHLLDLWDSFENKKINKSSQAQKLTTLSSIPTPPPLPPIVKADLFVSEIPVEADATFNTELAAAVKKRKNKTPANSTIEKPKHNKPLDDSLFTELKQKAATFTSTSTAGNVDLEQQLRLRIKKLEAIEKEIKNLAVFDSTAKSEAAYLETQFDTVLYDKPNAFYSPHGSINQYYEDLEQIDILGKKLNQKMIDPKKVGLTTSWTEGQKNRFNQKKETLIQQFGDKKTALYTYGYTLALESAKIANPIFATVQGTLEQLVSQEKGGGANISYASLAKELTYLYFITRFGIYGPIEKLSLEDPQMVDIKGWCTAAVESVKKLVLSLQELASLLQTRGQAPDDFGRRIIAPLATVINIIVKIMENQTVSGFSKLQADWFEMCKGLADDSLIGAKDYQGDIKSHDNYSIPSLQKKNK